MNLGEIVAGFGKGILAGAAGAAMVSQWRDYRIEAARSRIDEVVASAVRQQDSVLISSVFTAFSNEIREAASWEVQDHLSQLLWYYKVSLDRHL